MIKAPAPMIGGMICPPVEAAASIAPDVFLSYPTLCISGIVRLPVATTLPADVPLIIPISPEAKIATLAGPPRCRPVRAKAKLMKYSPTLDACKNAAKMMNKMI